MGRVLLSIKIDWREGKKGRLEGKVASIARRLGRAPRTR